MSDATGVTDLDRPARRSTRIDQAIPITVMGIDAWRGPYREQVSTTTISAHGCRYESKHQVMNDSLVILELNGTKPNDPPISARGRVKWVKRPDNSGDLYQTAIELEDPGNIWGIATPPKDWLPYTATKPVPGDTTQPKPVAVPKKSAEAITDKKPPSTETVEVAPAKKPAPPVAAAIPPGVAGRPVASPGSRPMGQLMGEFQQQMEKMLSEAAASAVRERSGELLAGIRSNLREEARKILAELAPAEAKPWVEKSLKQLAHASEEAIRVVHAQWTKKVEADLKRATEHLDQHSRQLEEQAGALATSTAERLQRLMETSRHQEVDRFIARLKEQISPVLDHAQKVSTDLNDHAEKAEKIMSGSLEQTAERMEEAWKSAFEKFESEIQARIGDAAKQIESAGKEAVSLALQGLRGSYQEFEVQARRRLEAALQPVAETALASVRGKTEEASQHFATEISNYSRSHLEYVSNAIADLARGLAKSSKD